MGKNAEIAIMLAGLVGPMIGSMIAIWAQLTPSQQGTVITCCVFVIGFALYAAWRAHRLFGALAETEAKRKTLESAARKFADEAERPLSEIVGVRPYVDVDQDHGVTYHANDRGPSAISVRADLMVTNFGLLDVTLREVKDMSVTIAWKNDSGSAKSEIHIGDRIIGDRRKLLVRARNDLVRVLSVGGRDEAKTTTRHAPPVSSALFGSICVRGVLISEDQRDGMPFTVRAPIPFRIRNNG